MATTTPSKSLPKESPSVTDEAASPVRRSRTESLSVFNNRAWTKGPTLSSVLSNSSSQNEQGDDDNDEKQQQEKQAELEDKKESETSKSTARIKNTATTRRQLSSPLPTKTTSPPLQIRQHYYQVHHNDTIRFEKENQVNDSSAISLTENMFPTPGPYHFKDNESKKLPLLSLSTIQTPQPLQPPLRQRISDSAKFFCHGQQRQRQRRLVLGSTTRKFSCLFETPAEDLGLLETYDDDGDDGFDESFVCYLPNEQTPLCQNHQKQQQQQQQQQRNHSPQLPSVLDPFEYTSGYFSTAGEEEEEDCNKSKNMVEPKYAVPIDLDDEDDKKPQQPESQSSHAWQVLRDKIKDGHFLLPTSSLITRTTAAATKELQQQQPPKRVPSPRNQRSRSTLRREAQDEIRSGFEFTIWHCLALFAIFIIIGVVAFSFLLATHWTWTDAIYFSLVTCTTVGYGDLVPSSSTAGLLFSSIYALVGVCFLGIALGVLGNHVIAAQEVAVEHTSTIAKKRLLQLFSNYHDETSHHPYEQQRQQQQKDDDDDEVTALFREHPLERQKPSPFWTLSFQFARVMTLLIIFAALIVRDPGISDDNDIVQALYYTILTATTVGYGDYAPVTQSGRLLAIFFIPLAVGAMGTFLSSVAEAIMDTRATTVRMQLASRELTARDLEIMDVDGDGQVTRAEFLEFMLVAMNKVDRDFIQEMRNHFDRLDVNGTGCLSKQSLIQQARNKLQRIHRKLELATYKHHLLQQAAAAAAQQRGRPRTAQEWSRAAVSAFHKTFCNVQNSFRSSFSPFRTSNLQSGNNNNLYNNNNNNAPFQRHRPLLFFADNANGNDGNSNNSHVDSNRGEESVLLDIVHEPVHHNGIDHEQYDSL